MAHKSSEPNRRIRVTLQELVLACCFLAAASGQNLDFGSRDARHVPDWLNKITIYELWPNAFSAEGTLKGAIPRLPWIADLGASVVYLGPIAKHSNKPYTSPYNISDYNAVDPQYGTEADLHDFIDTAHKLNLKVMLDIVYYHTAPDGVLMRDPALLVHTPAGKVARGFWPQPLPDFKNPKTRKYLIDSLVHWVRDFHADGFRCDVGAGVPIDFWDEARDALDKVDRNVILLSESDRPDDQLHAFDINYNFQGYLTLRSIVRDGAPAIKFRENWEQTKATMPRGARILRFSDNHDWQRAVLQFGEKGALAASMLNFTLDGVPFLYNGQEIGDPQPTHWIERDPIQWPHPSDANDDKQPEKTLAAYKKLFAMRAKYPELTSGELIWIDNTEPDSVLSFLRKKGEDEILVIINLSNRDQHVTVDLPVMDYSSVENLLKPGKTWFSLYSGRVSADLGAFDAVVGKRLPPSPLPQ